MKSPIQFSKASSSTKRRVEQIIRAGEPASEVCVFCVREAGLEN